MWMGRLVPRKSLLIISDTTDLLPSKCCDFVKIKVFKKKVILVLFVKLNILDIEFEESIPLPPDFLLEAWIRT